MANVFETLKHLCSPIWSLYSVRSLLYWDQQVQMSVRGGSVRALHFAALERVTHQLLTSADLARALQDCEQADPVGEDRYYVRAVRRAYDQAAKLPSSLVEERARVNSRAVEAWAEARRANRFEDFLPHLREVFRLARAVADCRGFGQHPYDAMIDEYEPGMTTATVDSLFSQILPDLVQLVGAIAARPSFSDRLLQQTFPAAGQKEFSRYLLEAIGFDFDCGRLDQSTHPFCSSSSSVDIRLTDRIDEKNLLMSIFGGLHEGGHGLYEQGCPEEWNATPLGGGCSLGIHESQSRLWENFVGRSLPFWKAHFPRLRSIFPAQLNGYSVEDFYRAINRVRPSFIRVEADEVTYTLHIALRFRLERDMLGGDLDPKDLPEAWNQAMKEGLGIVPHEDRVGCLQDIHWSDGLIGYFPTYSLGNLVAAQLWRRLQQDLPDLGDQLEAGDGRGLLGWMREKVHRHAASLTPEELVQQACGEPLQAQPFLDYLREKYSGLYGL